MGFQEMLTLDPTQDAVAPVGIGGVQIFKPGPQPVAALVQQYPWQQAALDVHPVPYPPHPTVVVVEVGEVEVVVVLVVEA